MLQGILLISDRARLAVYLFPGFVLCLTNFLLALTLFSQHIHEIGIRFVI